MLRVSCCTRDLLDARLRERLCGLSLDGMQNNQQNIQQQTPGCPAGAITTLITLLMKPDNRIAAVTMLGKTVELCMQSVSP